MTKLSVARHVSIYDDPAWYAAMPSVLTRPNGEVFLAFRRAPERRTYGFPGNSHADASSHLALVRSADNATTWSQPEIFFVHPLGGSQDPCLCQLHDGSMICTSYGWIPVDPGVFKKKPGYIGFNNHHFLGGFYLRSIDGGRSWKGPYLPPRLNDNHGLDHEGKPYASFNRGSLVQLPGGRLCWPVTCHSSAGPDRGKIMLLASDDGGFSWEEVSTIASDETISFNETSLYLTPGGNLVAFIRTFGTKDKLAIARSFDGGTSFRPFELTEIIGHPQHALRLPDGNVLLTYAYRYPPFEIRGVLLNPECDALLSNQEICIRSDGGNADIGYPWSTLLHDGSILVVYYFNQDDAHRTIEGTVLEYSPDCSR